jgi:hypothetical protein
MWYYYKKESIPTKNYSLRRHRAANSRRMLRAVKSRQSVVQHLIIELKGAEFDVSR